MRFAKKKMQSSFYFIERPPLKKAAPLLMMLHGYGSNEEDLFSFSEHLPLDFHIISIRAPYPLPQGGFAWYGIEFDLEGNKKYDFPQAKNSLTLLENFIMQLKEKLNASEVFLMGFSQGAILSYALALNQDFTSYVVAMSGYLEENLLFKKDISFHHLKEVFISHGTEDPIIPYSWAKKAPLFLNKHNIKNTFHKYPFGHTVSPENFFAMKNWLKNCLLKNNHK